MNLVWLMIFFIIGCIFGSFFNVVGLRVPQNIPFSLDRSYCPTCHKQLHWYELIPIMSYLIQQGQCKGCSCRISPIYPFIELSTGTLFAFSFWKIGLSGELFVALLLVSVLIIIFVTDVTYMVIPDKVLLFFLPLFLIMRFAVPLDPWYDAILGAAVGFILLASLIILSQGGMGGGDMKLFALLGIVLGWKSTLLTLFISSLTGAVLGIVLILIGIVRRRQRVPFGPFIIAGALISYFYGESIIYLYLTWF